MKKKSDILKLEALGIALLLVWGTIYQITFTELLGSKSEERFIRQVKRMDKIFNAVVLSAPEGSIPDSLKRQYATNSFELPEDDKTVSPDPYDFKRWYYLILILFSPTILI